MLSGLMLLNSFRIVGCPTFMMSNYILRYRSLQGILGLFNRRDFYRFCRSIMDKLIFQKESGWMVYGLLKD